MILCVIPARAGSKGLPGKHMKLIEGKPVISYTIEAAKKVNLFDKIVVTTNDTLILKYCDKNCIDKIKRPESYAKDNSTIDMSLKHAVNMVEKEFFVDIVVWLQANVPIRNHEHITAIINRLVNNKVDSVISLSKVGWPIEKSLRLTKNSFCSPYFKKSPKHMNRQNYPVSYIPNGAVYAIKRDVLMQTKKSNDPYDYFFGKKVSGFVFEEYQYGIEIDNEQDFNLCKMYLNN